MQGKTVALWTWQTDGFSLTEGTVDLTLSRHYLSDTIRSSYRVLASRLGTDQIVWCFTKREVWQARDGRVEWSLSVPEQSIIGILDTWVWERIIDSGAAPPRLLEQWKYEAIRCDEDYEEFVKHREREYLAEQPTSGSWWNHLITDVIVPGDSTVLLRHPLPRHWIVAPDPGDGL